MNKREKIDTLIDVAKKYKIDDPGVPYVVVRYWHPNSNTRETVELGGSTKVQHVVVRREPATLAWFVLGMGYMLLISALLFWVVTS